MDRNDDNRFDMNGNFLKWFFSMMQQQGLSFVLLGIAVWFFWQDSINQEMKMEELRQENLQCVERITLIYKEHQIMLIETIEDNTEALKRIEKLH